MQKQKVQKNEKKDKKGTKKRQVILSAKADCPDQNAINLTSYELSNACESVLAKIPSFIQT